MLSDAEEIAPFAVCAAMVFATVTLEHSATHATCQYCARVIAPTMGAANTANASVRPDAWVLGAKPSQSAVMLAIIAAPVTVASAYASLATLVAAAGT